MGGRRQREVRGGGAASTHYFTAVCACVCVYFSLVCALPTSVALTLYGSSPLCWAFWWGRYNHRVMGNV